MTQFLNLRSGNSGVAFVGVNDLDTLLWSAAHRAWYVGPGGGGGAVSSVFGRIGAVVAQTGDYDGDQVDNVSSVPGSSVSDALEYLLANAGAVASVFGRTGVVVAQTGDYDSDQVDNLSTVAGSSVSDALDTLDARATGVSSVFSRTGAVAAALGDYTGSLVSNTATRVAGSTVTAALDAVADMQDPNVATTGNVALTGTPANIDAGVALVSGTTLIFVWLQTNANENGVYVYNSAGAWTRAPQWQTVADFRIAQPFQILGGTLYGGRLAWVKLPPTTVGTSPIIFNTALDIQQPTADGQALQYRASANQMQPAGIKTLQLTGGNQNIDVTQGSCFQLNVQPVGAFTLTLGNTGAFTPLAATFDIRVALAFPGTVVNALAQTIMTFPAAGGGFSGKWFGSALFSGQWQSGSMQEAT